MAFTGYISNDITDYSHQGELDETVTVSGDEHESNRSTRQIFKGTKPHTRYDAILYTEAIFRSMLVMERKRTERTDNPFMLIRIDISRLPSEVYTDKIIGQIIQHAGAVTRETDIKGWFTEGSVIGIIITEFDVTHADFIFDKIRQSIQEVSIKGSFPQDLMSKDIFPCKGVGNNERTIDFITALYTNNRVDSTANTLLRICKRSIDIFGSIIGILLFFPLFLIIPICIKLSSKGPVFFTQKRVGQYGKTFTCLKFRTMKPSNDDSMHKDFVKKFINGECSGVPSSPDPLFKIKDDPRVTGIGRLLRKTSLDELPQFFNVLFGDMSLVGPRPAIPYEVEEYNTWHRRRVLELKPGVTGIWQVHGRSRTDFTNMVRMDIQYINKWSPLLDLRLIATTPVALITAKGAC